MSKETHPGKLGVWTWLDGFTAPEAADFAKQLEDWGYSTLWIPEAVGRDPFALIGYLAGCTEKLTYATGIANIYEVTSHLRGEAGARQVQGARVGMTHVIGLGSACGIHILEKV